MPAAAQTVLLIRHAKAGDRDRWLGDDRQRPLTKAGRRQALALAEQLAPYAPGRVVSSPALRCTQTVEPLAAARGLPVETAEALAEGASLAAALALFDRLDGDAALCSHGDVIGELLEYLVASGVLRPPLPPTAKGGAWLLRREGGAFVGARYLPAP
jgi:phosphohistidine phosphatase SixA